MLPPGRLYGAFVTSPHAMPEPETRVERMLRTARFARRLARTCRADGDFSRAARLFVIAGEVERDAKRCAGPWWNVWDPAQLTIWAAMDDPECELQG